MLETNTNASTKKIAKTYSSSSFYYYRYYIYNMHRTLLYHFLGKVLSWLSPGEEADVFKLVADIGLETRNLDALEIRRGSCASLHGGSFRLFVPYDWDITVLGYVGMIGMVRMIFPFQPNSHV